MRRGRRSFTPSFEQLESRLALSTYYVATTGNDTAAGTSTAPWLTLQHGVDTIKAGEVRAIYLYFLNQGIISVRKNPSI